MLHEQIMLEANRRWKRV